MAQDLKAFTVRLPPELVEQIEARATANRRWRNAEITQLLEDAIDRQVAEDLKVLKTTGGSS